MLRFEEKMSEERKQKLKLLSEHCRRVSLNVLAKKFESFQKEQESALRAGFEKVKGTTVELVLYCIFSPY